MLTKMRKSLNKPSTLSIFAEQTSIHGMLYVCQKTRGCSGTRVAWILLSLATLSVILYECKNTTEKYFDYQVVNLINFNVKDEISFPAITICSESLFKRSIVGSNAVFLYYASSFYGDVDNAKKNVETCTYTNGSYLNRINPNMNNIMFQDGLRGLLKLTSPTSKDSLLKCRWNNKIIECGDIFVDHLIDYGLCFTFNPSNSTNRILQTLMGSDMNTEPMKSQINFVSKSSTLHNSLKILMDAQKSEYCGIFRKWDGVGFRIQIHDRNMDATFLSKHGIMVHPGYSYNIGIKSNFYHRKTEHLGFCKSSFNIKEKHSVNTYVQTGCYLMCFIKLVWHYCRCVPSYLVGRVRHVSKLMGINAKENQLCTEWKASCMNDIKLSMYGNTILEHDCFKCPHACVETKYDYEVSMTRLLLRTLKNETLNGINKKPDFLMINFHHHSVMATSILEKQKFTTTDALIYIGGIISLFLGMSVMSVFEPFYYILFYYGRYIKKPMWQNSKSLRNRERKMMNDKILYGKEIPLFLIKRRSQK